MTKTQQRAVLKDIRKQLKWIEEAIKEGDQEWIATYSQQLSCTALMLDTRNN